MTSGRAENAFDETRHCPTCGLPVTSFATVCPQDGTSLTPLSLQDPAFEKYQMLEILGQGGMGVIYKARHLILNKYVAIKTLHSNLASPEAVRRFQIEGRAASSLSHPNIVAVYDLGVTQFGQPFMVMEFVDGITLADLLQQKGRLSKREFFKIFVQVCQGLSQAHKKSVLHRDIKPSNIMISSAASDDESDVRIMDFGIAKIMSDTENDGGHLTKTGDAIGSPHYMSPEQARGGKVDQRADIYSLGCVMYEALTGSPPFQGNAPMETMLMHMERPPLPMKEASLGEEIDPRLEAIVLRTLAKRPDDRYSDVDELMSALIVLRDGKADLVGSSADRASNQLPGRRSGDQSLLENARRSSTLLFACLTLCLTAAVGSGFWFAHQHDDQSKKGDDQLKSGGVSAPLSSESAQSANSSAPATPGNKIATTLDPTILSWEAKNFKDEIKIKLARKSETMDLIPIFGGARVNSEELKLLKDATWITRLNIPHGDFDDVGLEAISGLTQLNTLALPGDEQLVDLHALKPLVNLETLKLGSTSVDRAGVEVISNLKRLEYLDLTQTNISEKDLLLLEKLPLLKLLELHDTRLDGNSVARLKKKRPQLQVFIDQRVAPSEKHVGDLQNDANEFLLKNDWNRAEALLKEAEETIQHDPKYDAFRKADFFMYLGDVKNKRHFYTQAAEKFAIAIKVLQEKSVDSKRLAAAYSNRADVLEKSSAAHPELWAEASKDRLKAIAIFQKLMLHPDSVEEQSQYQAYMVEDLRHLAQDYAEANEPQMAVEAAEKERNYARKFGIPAGVDVAAYNVSIGDSLQHMRHFSAASPYYDRGDQFFREHPKGPLAGEPLRARMKLIQNLLSVGTVAADGRAEKLLKELDDLASLDVQDRRHVLTKLIDLYTKEKKSAQKKVLQKRLDEIKS